MTSAGYYLPITQFTQVECDAIQSPLFNAILPKMGFKCHFPRAVVLGPKKYQGKQLADYSTHQYISHLEQFIGYIRMDSEMGNLMRIQVDQYQQIMGTQQHFLELDSTKYQYGEASRINSCRIRTQNMEYISS